MEGLYSLKEPLDETKVNLIIYICWLRECLGD